MGLIQSAELMPKILVRRLRYRMGFRYSLHVRSLPGCPDVVSLSRRIMVFVHGCFWHQHAGGEIAHLPKSRTEYWERKLTITVERDQRHVRQLRDMDWSVPMIWACETADENALRDKLWLFLSLRNLDGCEAARTT
jgi:DNA mismatch endonuclease (patch repair protein)